MTQTIIVLRHAHRFKIPNSAADNGISPKGKRQAKRLARYFLKHHGRKKVPIISSPKLRCRQTIAPLAEALGVKVAIDDRLVDSRDDLHARAKSLRAWLKRQKAPLIVLCSHGDFIPLFLHDLTGARIHLAKGGWIKVEISAGKTLLIDLIQEP